MDFIMRAGKWIIDIISLFLDFIMRAGKWIFGIISLFWGFITPIQILVLCCIAAIMIDFVTGNIACYYRAHRAGSKYAFESDKAWKTVWKLTLALVGIGFAWSIDVHVLAFLPELHLAEFFCAFLMGCEFWSFLENAADISDHQVFRWLKRFMKDKAREETSIDFDKYCK